jgi:hypothetical protein
MKKLVTTMIIMIILIYLTGCVQKNELTFEGTDAAEITSINYVNTVEATLSENIEEPEVASTVEIEVPQDVQLWAQYEIDYLIRMLTIDGFFKNTSQSDNLIKIEIQDKKISNLKLVKKLEFVNGSTLDLYRLEFKLLPQNLVDQTLFSLDSDGWITSDENFTYGDANGYELKKGQLYLLIHDTDGVLTSMGIRRTEMLTDLWCEDLLAYYNYPPGVNFNLSKVELQKLHDYWQFDAEWSFTMPCYNGFGDVWHVGLGYANEWGIGVPYDRVGSTSRPSDGIAAYSFSAVRDFYYDGLVVTSLDGFYGDDHIGPGFSVNQYVSSTQPDCKTSRGVHVGDTVETLKMVYPEIIKNEGDANEYNSESVTTEYDSCWFYAPEQSNRSILFLVKDGIIVQIDIADGLDGQYTTPQWIAKYRGE